MELLYCVVDPSGNILSWHTQEIDALAGQARHAGSSIIQDTLLSIVDQISISEV